MPNSSESSIVLATLNARWIHAAFGLRYLKANMGPLADKTTIMEFEIASRPLDVVEAILAKKPRIVGLGVYIWNVTECTQVVRALRDLAPHIILVIGGPEVGHDQNDENGSVIEALAHHVVRGEGDLAFPELCGNLLAGRPPGPRWIDGGVPDLDKVRLPYDLYADRDVRDRVMYVEASRGCPFACEFCLSSFDIPVRIFELDRFLAAMDSLLERGARTFKFVDRTFNLNLRVASEILDFFLERQNLGIFLHFEMIPDRFPDSLKERIAAFEEGRVQFEIGIQSFDDQVNLRIGRRQDTVKTIENLTFLREQTGVHLHTDLIAGLPGESLEGFAAGFDRLVSLHPHEIQVGILKRLKGTPISRHDDLCEMIWSASPPYEILKTSTMDFPTLQRMGRFARCWDRVANSGQFLTTLPLLLAGDSAFHAFVAFSDRIQQRFGRTHGIALTRMAEAIFDDLVAREESDPRIVAEALWEDYTRAGRSDRPAYLRPFNLPSPPRHSLGHSDPSIHEGSLPRQDRYQRAVTPDSSGPRPSSS